MSRTLHRRLMPILAFMLVANAVASPIIAHDGMEGTGPTSEAHSPGACHESSDPVPSSHHSGSLDCCAAAMHCGCMNLPAGSVFASVTPISAALHDSILGPAQARAPQTAPESFLRPPIS